MRDKSSILHLSPRTDEAYVGWVRRFVTFSGFRHPKDMDKPEILAFLTHLAVDLKVAAATQSQALAAILFLYKHVLDRPISGLVELPRARTPSRLPTVLSSAEVGSVIAQLRETRG